MVPPGATHLKPPNLSHHLSRKALIATCSLVGCRVPAWETGDLDSGPDVVGGHFSSPSLSFPIHEMAALDLLLCKLPPAGVVL